MFVQHSRYYEAVTRRNGTFTAQCLERPEDPGVIRNIPHVIKVFSESHPSPVTVYTLGLTLTESFCFVRNLTFRCNSHLHPSEADRYLLLDMVIDYFQTDFIHMYKRNKLAITSETEHFAEMVLKKGFRLHSRTMGQNLLGWRAIKCLKTS